MRSWSQTWCLMQQQAHVSVCVDTWLHGRRSHCSLTRILTLWLWNLHNVRDLQVLELANYIFCTRKSETWKLLKLTSCNLGDIWIWSFSISTLQTLSRHLNPSALLRLGIWRKVAKELMSLGKSPFMSAVFAFPNPKRSLPRYWQRSEGVDGSGVRRGEQIWLEKRSTGQDNLRTWDGPIKFWQAQSWLLRCAIENISDVTNILVF